MSLLRLLFGFSVLVLSGIGITYLQQDRIQKLTGEIEPNYQQQVQSEQLGLELQSKMPRFGFENLWADWNYLQFIQYFGDTPARNKTGYFLIPKYFQQVVKDDPRFIRGMLVFSTANTIYAVSPKTTVKLLNEVVAEITPEFDPLTPYIWSYKGVDEMLFLGDIKAAQHSYEMAAEWALKTNDPHKEALAQRNRETAGFLAKNPDSKKARVAAWMSILQGGLNEETQKLAIREILSLGGKVSFTPEGLLKVEFPEED
jgi:hypothetical protein